MSIISPKSNLNPRRQSKGKVPKAYIWWERPVKKVGFESRVKKRRRVEMMMMMMMMYMNCHE